MIGPKRLKCKSGFYYEGFITLNKTKISTKQKSQAHRKKSTWGLGETDKIKSKANFQLISIVAGHLISIPLGRQHCKTIKPKREYPQGDREQCCKELWHGPSHTTGQSTTREVSTTVKAVVTTSPSKPLVFIGSNHNSDLPSYMALYSCLSLISWQAQLGGKTLWPHKQNGSYSNMLKEGIQEAPTLD